VPPTRKPGKLFLVISDPERKQSPFQEKPAPFARTASFFTATYPSIISNAGALHAGVAPESNSASRGIWHIQLLPKELLSQSLDDGGQGKPLGDLPLRCYLLVL
jgi:hypothetical protein